MTSPAEYLYGLPEPVQRELVKLTRAAGGMSRDEKVEALEVVDGVMQAFLLYRGGGKHLPALLLLEAAAQVIAELDRDAFPRTSEEVA